MANNIEIKARAAAFDTQREIARGISNASSVFTQQDTFFNVPEGRLKLRELRDADAQLIFYQRINQSGPTLSDYHISELPDATGMKSVLSKAYGVRQIVSKQRELFMVGRTRIHFDTVNDLGQFIELEVVLNDGDSIPEANAEAKRLMNQLAIQPEHLVDVAYVDLLDIAA
ncbi:class IV adenylate cyclase [Arenicella xantha]|uniref:Adenylate cyclase n=1 Tax=Arenicella xantha TaxID=644221 RepID=A0A395JEL0_9GAMM|nr:class IV adenylate cyclase [Arenicella xantha]RBP47107.1 adenylate cyclase [Arenicella xantha]